MSSSKHGGAAAAGVPKPLLIEEHGKVLLLTLNNPPRHNALQDATLSALETAFRDIADRVRAVVLTGHGKNFCSGLDLSEQRSRTPESVLLNSRAWHRVLDLMQHSGRPIIVAMQGAVIGGGFELAAVGHVRIADEGTFFQLPEGKRGIYIGGGGSVRIARTIGLSRMTEIMLTGRRVDVTEAERMGLVHEVVAAGSARDRGLEVATQIAENAPLVNYMITQALPRITEMGSDGGHFVESVATALTHANGDAHAGISAFLDKGKAKEPGKKR
jgi:enoyl-CoA hydratase/carnithine racemase